MNLLTLVLREVIASYLTGNKRCAKWTDRHKDDSLIKLRLRDCEISILIIIIFNYE